MEYIELLTTKQSILAASCLAIIITLYICKRLFLVRLRDQMRQQDTEHNHFYQVLILALNAPLNLTILTILLWLVRYGLTVSGLITKEDTNIIDHAIKAMVIVTLVLFIERWITYAIKVYATRSPLLNNTRNIASGAIRACLIGLGLLLVLGSMGISVTPLIASLGITSLAVALALQPTLENFFSGVQILIDKPFRIGDYIELESGEQGFVDKIGWRSTWIKMLPNNIVIVPNGKLSQSKIINYYYPEKELSVPVEVGVHYSSDLEFVERVTLEVANQVLFEHEWGVESYDPFVVFHTFDNSSINFTVMLRTKEYFNRFFVKSTFIKALHRRYNDEGIVIPFPITALNLQQEGAESAMSGGDSQQAALQMNAALQPKS
ncbi:mechanosensitive ion channel family protein [Alteromonas gilva]|uniref:Small-conductance mechanosensitive channel n=1 Tax=Alteromonas gilva TaxID=2987522 RepID=A0ABT5L217_9ALTE|nr:mechanosensitive ion channel family protein [Alteromonas gilva]MDC8831089.1 mechanosensitive ion channel family protein [Alteromonas gilva]